MDKKLKNWVDLFSSEHVAIVLLFDMEYISSLFSVFSIHI